MKKLALCISFCFLAITNVVGQEKLNFHPGNDISINDSNTIKLYKWMEGNPCNQSKAVSIVYQDEISTSFDYVRTISTEDTKKIMTLLHQPSTYGNKNVTCSDTDYALLVYNKEDILIAYINISFYCNKLNSSPPIKERQPFSDNIYRNIGFSRPAREELIKLCGVTDWK